MNKLKQLFIKYKEAISYLFFGGLTTIVNWSSYGAAVKFLNLNYNLANAISWLCAVFFAFVTNKLWVFESKHWGKNTFIGEFVPFFTSRLVTGIFETAALPLVVKMGINQSFLGVENFPAKMLVSIVVVILNYVLSKFFIFKKRS